MNTNHGTLNVTILFQVFNHLIHDRGWNSESIADIRASGRCQHGVDTNKFTTGIDQSTTRVALVDGSIGLDETLYTVSSEGTGFGRNHTSCNRIVQSQRITNGKYPFTYTHIVAIGNNDGRQVLGIDLNQGKISGLVGSDDTGRIFLVVIKTYGEFVSTVHNVVVGHDIAIGRDDDSRTCSCTLRCLYLTLAFLAIIALSAPEETTKGI